MDIQELINKYCSENIETNEKHFVSIEYIYQCFIKQYPEISLLPSLRVKQTIMNSNVFDFNHFRRISVFKLPDTMAMACGCKHLVAYNAFMGYAFKNKCWGIFQPCPCENGELDRLD